MPVQGAWDGPGEKNLPPGPEREEQQQPTAESQIPTFKLPEALKHGVLKSGPVCCPDYHGAKQITEDNGSSFPTVPLAFLDE